MLANDQASLDSFSYFEENRRPLEYVDYGALYYRIYFADKGEYLYVCMWLMSACACVCSVCLCVCVCVPVCT